MRRPSFLGPGPETDSEGPDEAFRRDGFDVPRPPPTASSSVSGRLGEAVLRGGEAIVAAGAAGVGQAVERFGFRNVERAAAQVEQRALPQIIGRPADAEQLIMRAGQRAQEFSERQQLTSSSLLQSKPRLRRPRSRRCWPRQAQLPRKRAALLQSRREPKRRP